MVHSFFTSSWFRFLLVGIFGILGGVFYLVNNQTMENITPIDTHSSGTTARAYFA